MISKCSVRWAIPTGLKTTHAIWMGVAKVSLRIPFLTFSPDDFLIMIDESHMTMGQIKGMYNGDRSRKEMLVNYGFRLPSALDNRPPS